MLTDPVPHPMADAYTTSLPEAGQATGIAIQ